MRTYQCLVLLLPLLLTIALVGVIAALASYAYYTLKQSEGVYTGATTITVQGEGEAMKYVQCTATVHQAIR